MSYLVLDVESTIKNKGHPFTPSNKLCVVGTSRGIYDIEYSDSPFGEHLREIQSQIDAAETLVGFNIKFDLHWLRRYGIRVPPTVRVHDCQLGYFLLTAQEHRLPSLNDVGVAYGLGEKYDVVEKEYWSQGIDTPYVPYSVLVEYLQRDLELTEQVYLRQLVCFQESPKLHRLFELQCEDLLVLEEMEWNGLPYDKEKSLEKAVVLEGQMAALRDDLNQLTDGVVVNWNSPEQVSAVLYGGVIKEAYQEDFLFTYKDPKREPVWKKRWREREHSLPRLVEPLKNSQLQKDGVYSTSESTLLELNTKGKATHIVRSLLSYAKLSKELDYFQGIPKLIEEMEWEDNVLHGNLNQCNVVTGRLSSNKPNQQNMTEEVHELIGSRYD